MLISRLESVLGLSYAELRARIDVEDVVKKKGASGVEYFVEVSVEAVNEIDPGIEVIGYVSEVAGRRFLPPSLSLSFSVTPDGSRTRRGDWSESDS